MNNTLFGLGGWTHVADPEAIRRGLEERRSARANAEYHVARYTVEELEAKARGARLTRIEAMGLPAGPRREQLLRSARLDELEVRELARSERNHDEAVARFEGVYGPGLRRAPEALRMALGTGRGQATERRPSHGGDEAA